MAKNTIGTLYDDNGVGIASTSTGKGATNYAALCVSDNGVPIQTTTGGSATVATAANLGTNTVVKGAPGRLCRVLVSAAPTTTTGTTTIYDNATTASGTALAVISNATAVGTVIDVNMPAALGITVGGNANAPGMTISYI